VIEVSMSESSESPEAIARLLKRLSPEDLARVRALLDDTKGEGTPLSVNIGGHVIGCSIGTGASLKAGDIITALDGVPADGTRRSAGRLDRELAARNLADRTCPDYAKTKYAKRLGFPNEQQQVVPLRTVGTFFALTAAPLIDEGAKQKFLQWMNCNERRYQPIDDCFFLPGMMPDLISKAHVWHNGHRHRFSPVVSSYSTYIAIELEEGYIEYGFNPGSYFEQDKDIIYYAKVVGGFVAFLRFLRHLAETFGGDPSATSVGLAMRGTSGTRLRCITNRVTEHFQGNSTPDHDGFRWMSAATPGTDWSLDRLARQAAVEVLDHWSYTGPARADIPELTDGKYTGDHYRADFHGQWY
jgi:hypothetical protein